MIAAGESYIEDVPSQRLSAVRDRIDATTDYAPLAACEAVLICVPTPLTANREPDLGPLERRVRGARPGRAGGSADRARVDHVSGHDP